MMNFDFAIIGGDRRTSCMAEVFAQRGFRVLCYGIVDTPNHPHIFYSRSLKETINSAPTLIFGIPFEKNHRVFFDAPMPEVSLAELQRLLRKKQKLYAGMIPEQFRTLCEDREIGCYDFMKEETISILNAVATAEGAIAEAIIHQNTQLHHSKALIVGYGRCGKVLADKLKGLSTLVTVCSNSLEELALARSLGFKTLNLNHLFKEAANYEYFFNTAPVRIFTAPIIELIKSDSIIIDIASNQVGVDYEACKKLNRNAYFCPGLPGKYACKTCASLLADYILP